MDVCKYAEHQVVENLNPHSEHEHKWLGYAIPAPAEPLAAKERRAHKRHVKRLHEERQAELRRAIQTMMAWPWCGVWNKPVELTFGVYEEKDLVVAGWHCPDCAAVKKAAPVNTALLRAKERFKVVHKRNTGKLWHNITSTDLRVMLDAGQRGWWDMQAEQEKLIRDAIDHPQLGSTQGEGVVCGQCGNNDMPIRFSTGLCTRCDEAAKNQAKNQGQEVSMLGGLRGGKTVQQDRELLERMGLSEIERRILKRRGGLQGASGGALMGAAFPNYADQYLKDWAPSFMPKIPVQRSGEIGLSPDGRSARLNEWYLPLTPAMEFATNQSATNRYYTLTTTGTTSNCS